jgi:hypothetical protein
MRGLSGLVRQIGRPSLWAEEALRFSFDPWQRELMDSPALDLLVLAARQVGKTEAAGALVSHFAIMHEGSLTVLTSATQRQATIICSRVLSDLRQATGAVLEWQQGKEYEYPEMDRFGRVRIVRSSVMSVGLSNGSMIVAIPPSPDSARGYSPDLIVVDESARVRSTLFHAISPMRGAKRVRLVAMSTAWTMAGWFWDLWSKDPDVHRIELSATDCPRISPEFLAKERVRLPRNIFEAEYFNKWFAPEGRLFSPELIASMFADSEVQPLGAPEVWKPTFLDPEAEIWREKCNAN